MGLAFWFPHSHLAFQAPVPPEMTSKSIFFLKALTVTSAILEATSRIGCHDCLAVFSDSLNFVQLFSSLGALPDMNWMLILVVNTLLLHSIDFHVFHVLGSHNMVADYLSRFRNAEALAVAPSLVIRAFSPPRVPLGAACK
ncbi:hypothetical protein EV363DRAFT_1175768 [Boletus edulis]|nr:hypothetical protein EV363DRAFT_1175768 [Boletus edulis]